MFGSGSGQVGNLALATHRSSTYLRRSIFLLWMSLLPPSLDQTLRAISPRFTPPPRALTGPLIWLCAVVLFVALFAQGFVRMGVAAWAVGLVYIVYDTALLIFVGRQTWRLRIPERGRGALPSEAEALDREVAILGYARTSPSVALGNTVHLTTTVIIAAYNEAPVLEATIEALRRQSHPPDHILIADDGSDDDTPAVLARVYGLATPGFGDRALSPTVPNLRWLRLARGGKAVALNTAIAMIDSDIIVTVDADTLLAPSALAAMRNAFEQEPALAAATGVLSPVCGNSVSGCVFQWFQTYEYVRNFLSRYAWMETNSLLLISGAFAGFRRDALVRIGGFDPDSLVEDYEVMHRIHRFARDRGLDWHVRVVGEAQASTDSPGSLMPFLRQRRRWFAGFLQTQYWNRDMIGNARYGALGTAMLPVKALDTVQPLYGLAAFGLLIYFVATGNLIIAFPVIVAMILKVIIDLAYLLWSLRLYRKWTGHRIGASGALLAAIVEPVTFQLLRHLGAAWGWVVFLTGRQVWGKTSRMATSLEQHDRSVDTA
jgi:cellulose synthase/poly-beta-1,6-N-acetylglucosamine synthase-like glycosyltransferase